LPCWPPPLSASIGDTELTTVTGQRGEEMSKYTDEAKKNGVPYYDRHKIVDLTCPHCGGRLSFLINEQKGSKHICSCGTWWQTGILSFETWVYLANGNINNSSPILCNQAV
jgi:hypothetical protein